MILVTGGAGFIGSHVVDELVRSNCEVRVVDDLSEGKLSSIEEHLRNGRVCFFEGDVRDAELVGKSVQDVDAVVHLAAVTSVPLSVENPRLTFDVNVNGTLNVLKACTEARVNNFVFVSSCSVYGEPSYLPIDEEHPTSPKSPYAASKLGAEAWCEHFEEKHGLRTTVLRLFNVYGPRQNSRGYAGVIAQFLERVKHKQPLTIYGDGSQTRDFVHVRDVADAVVKAIASKKTCKGEVFNIGFGQAVSVNKLAKTVIDLTGSGLDIVYAKPRDGDVKASFANVSKAEKLLDYQPLVPLEKGLRSLVEEAC
jgi:UDP-glucose 4-epimerase